MPVYNEFSHRVVQNGKVTEEVLENGILVSKSVNGEVVPIAIEDSRKRKK